MPTSPQTVDSESSSQASVLATTCFSFTRNLALVLGQWAFRTSRELAYCLAWIGVIRAGWQSHRSYASTPSQCLPGIRQDLIPIISGDHCRSLHPTSIDILYITHMYSVVTLSICFLHMFRLTLPNSLKLIATSLAPLARVSVTILIHLIAGLDPAGWPTPPHPL